MILASVDKTAELHDVNECMAVSLVNVNLELSWCMLDFTERQQASQLPCLLSGIVSASPTDMVRLDNSEILARAGAEVGPAGALVERDGGVGLERRDQD